MGWSIGVRYIHIFNFYVLYVYGGYGLCYNSLTPCLRYFIPYS